MAESAAYWARRPTGGGPLPAVPALAPDDDPHRRARRASRASRAPPALVPTLAPPALAPPALAPPALVPTLAPPPASLACLWRSVATVSRTAARLWAAA
jgi:hypothetical protein